MPGSSVGRAEDFGSSGRWFEPSPGSHFMKIKLKTMSVRLRFTWRGLVTHDNFFIKRHWYWSTGSYVSLSKTRSFSYDNYRSYEWAEQSRWIDRETAKADAARWELIHLDGGEQRSYKEENEKFRRSVLY